jgi:hypothetical protein
MFLETRGQLKEQLNPRMPFLLSTVKVSAENHVHTNVRYVEMYPIYGSSTTSQVVCEGKRY